MHAYWDIPNIYNSDIRESFVKVEERLVGGKKLAYVYKICYCVARNKYYLLSKIVVVFIYIIVTDMEGNIRIYRLLKGRGTDQ